MKIEIIIDQMDTVLEWLNHGLRYVRRLTLGFDLSLGRLLPFSTFMGTFDKTRCT